MGDLRSSNTVALLTIPWWGFSVTIQITIFYTIFDLQAGVY